MSLNSILSPQISIAIQTLFDISIDKFEFQATRKEFEGDITMVLFPLLKQIKSNPVELGNKIGQFLVENVTEVFKFNVVSGFLNVVISDNYYIDFFNKIKDDSQFGFVAATANEKAVMVEYSSPNTNKPLHLGHVRNNLLGYSVAEIIKASGKKVYKTQIINDRGIHICKSMLAWQKFGEGETPETSGLKGDKLVGKYYVEYNTKYQEELNQLQNFAEQAYDEFIKPKETNKQIIEFQKIIKAEQSVSINDNILWALGGLALSVYLYKKSSESEIKNLAIIGGIAASIATLNSVELNTIYTQQFIPIKKNYLEKNFKHLDKFKDKTKRDIINELMAENKERFPLLIEAQQMLLDWEAGKSEVIQLWKTMNQWVYDGFDTTYKNLGVDFDSKYYESNTYLLGKDVVNIGLDKGIFEKDPDGSVWIDLTDEGLDRKIVLRSDGTAVYMTQDIGTAIQRVKDFPDVGGMVYTVGNEQDYHFKVLFLIIKKLGFDWSENLFHLSYGMVELPTGKMKSREGTVVDADDLMIEMTQTAQKLSEDLGKLEGYSDDEKAKLYKTIGLGALKYYMLKVDPKKSMMFNPEESVDFAGNTGPFIQYTYARIQSIIRKANFDFANEVILLELHNKEKELLKQIALYPEIIQNAAHNHSPALLANYAYDLVKEYNSFYQNVIILGEENLNKKIFRVQLSKKVADIIKSSFKLLGIEVPERM